MNWVNETIFALASFFSAGAVSCFLNWIASTPWRRAVGAHWTERARLLWPVRMGMGVNPSYSAMAFGALEVALSGRLSGRCLIAAAAAFLGAILGGYPLARQIFPSIGFRRWLNSTLVAHVYLGTVMLIWTAGILLMPDELDWKSVVVFLAVPAFLVFAQWPLMRRSLLATRILRAPSERLRTLVESTAQQMRAAAPTIWLLDSPLANAVAFPLTGEIVFTDGLMEICTDGEVAAIASHEMAHLTEKGSLLALRVLSSLTFLPLLFLRPARHHGGPILMALVVIVTFAMWPVWRKWRHRMERRADASAIEGSEPGIYASALEKLHSNNQIPAVMKSQTHPSLYDRMIAAGLTPDFPRPKPPNAISPVHIAFWTVAMILCVMAATSVVSRSRYGPHAATRSGSLVQLTFRCAAPD